MDDITRTLQRLFEHPDAGVAEAVESLTEVIETPTIQPVSDLPDLSHLWVPQPGPQTLGYDSKADILFYGGAAGCGKSGLGLGLALTRHHRSIIFRKEASQCLDFVDELQSTILKTDKGWSGMRMSWDLAPITKFIGHRLDFGGLSDPGSEQKYKGRPHDLIFFDEGVDFTEHQVRFLSTWNRSSRPNQRCRVVIGSNPPAPTTLKQKPMGIWIIEFFAPWLDPQYRDPLGLGKAEPGELRWFVRRPGRVRDEEWPDGIPFYEEDPASGQKRTVIPQSRTFIPGRVSDNAYLRDSNYVTTLQALPEPLRSIMLEGDFTQALGDQPMALFPVQWLRDAVTRWKDQQDKVGKDHPRSEPMTALGFDVARGGADASVGAPRHGAYFDTLKTVPGSSTPDGPTAAGFAVGWARDGATIVVDAAGPGGSAYDHLRKTEVACRAYVGSTKAKLRDRTGKFQFPNLRSQSYWKFREALDPATPGEIMLPDDPDLITELSVLSYEERSGKIHVMTKEAANKELGRSTDKADAVVMAWTEPHETSWLPTRGKGSSRQMNGYSRKADAVRTLPMSGPIDYGDDDVI